MDAFILLVEDDDNDAFFFENALEKCHAVVPFLRLRTGTEALTYLDSAQQIPPQVPMPDLIVLDLKMPELDGFKVLEHLAEQPHGQKPWPPVVVLSSFLETNAISRAVRLGARDLFFKPFDLQSWKAMVQVILTHLNSGRRGAFEDSIARLKAAG